MEPLGLQAIQDKTKEWLNYLQQNNDEEEEMKHEGGVHEKGLLYGRHIKKTRNKLSSAVEKDVYGRK